MVYFGGKFIINNLRIMNKTKWSTQEQQMLKNLKENGENLSWGKIAQEINLKCENSSKNARQCRDKYVNYARFNEDQKIVTDWTQEEDRFLIKLYKESGPCWSKYVKIIHNKSENCFKNRFYNSVRRASKFIEDHQKKVLKSYRSFITYQSIIKILDLCVLVQKELEENMDKMNKKSLIFNCRQQLLQLIFIQNCILNESQTTQLIEQIKMVINKLKCFGIFKTKNKKAWNLTQKLVNIILTIGEDGSNQNILQANSKEESKVLSDQSSKIEETYHQNSFINDLEVPLDLDFLEFSSQKIIYNQDTNLKNNCLFLQILQEEQSQEYQLLLI